MTPLALLDIFRLEDAGLSQSAPAGGDVLQTFRVPSAERDRAFLKVTAETTEGWDHVAVSRPDRIPTFTELRQIYRLFFQHDEVAMQLFLPPGRMPGDDPHRLHLWRPQAGWIPLPPLTGATA